MRTDLTDLMLDGLDDQLASMPCHHCERLGAGVYVLDLSDGEDLRVEVRCTACLSLRGLIFS